MIIDITQINERATSSDFKYRVKVYYDIEGERNDIDIECGYTNTLWGAKRLAYKLIKKAQFEPIHIYGEEVSND